MRIDEHIAVLRHDGQRLADAAGRAGLDAPVPTCPEWRVRELVHHLGGVHRWATSYVTTGRTTPLPPGDEKRFWPAVADGELLDWFRAGHRTLVAALTDADPGLTCWAFLPAPSALAFWARRQAHETAIHRADAAAAEAAAAKFGAGQAGAGQAGAAAEAAPAWDPAFAVDGIEELLLRFFARRPERITAAAPVAVALVATDADAAWTVRLGPDGLRIAEGTQPAALTLTGAARDLYLLLWNRAGVERLEVDGDVDALEAWRAAAKVI